ncbi:uncharacterized protein N7459_005198 [Penicillium hispanicum]|uniref:uncharacterized protein n=1 Tax=Penicillium hispanicum TaxID=1080232 RepID=UPI0025411A7E|nr:uncharacterized protein N7459_005198 [Penicillium hispanicum]KAJ5585398.1 hypothetical protein N7459_005198 [Penicillium hispanicum]
MASATAPRVSESLPLLPGDAVFLVNPHNAHNHSEGRTRIAQLAPGEQARVIVPLLLEAFVTRFGEGDGFILQMHDSCIPWAPWSWSTTDEALARAVSAQLQQSGVRSELCQVSVSPAEFVQEADRCWTDWCQKFSRAAVHYPDAFGANVDRCCDVCGFSPSLDVSLLRCGRCRRT